LAERFLVTARKKTAVPCWGQTIAFCCCESYTKYTPLKCAVRPCSELMLCLRMLPKYQTNYGDKRHLQ